jgi:glycosyltransferase involved in cell wall biosynthesis
MKEIVFINSHPIQYFVPLYQEITSKTNIPLEVVYFDDTSLKNAHMDREFGTAIKWDIPMMKGYKYLFIKNNALPFLRSNRGFFSLMNFGIVKYLYKKPKSVIIIHGWKYFTFILAVIASRLFGHTVVLRGETPLNQELEKNKVITFFKHLYLKSLFLFVDFFLFIGFQNKRFYQSMSVDDNRLLFTPYSVDNKRFRAIHDNTTMSEARALLNLHENAKIILYSGKYISKKRPLDLLKAFNNLRDKSAILVMVGEGELRPELEAFIDQNSLNNRVILTGFINQSIIPLYYSAADVFVMCSGLGETWGLSVNEALNFGLPVIVSNSCGSAYDLVIPGVNGRIFETGDVNELRDIIEEYLNKSETERASISEESIGKADEYSYEQIIKSITHLSKIS